MKLWRRSDEWTQHASCWGSADHTLPPTRDAEESDKPVADVAKVRSICGGCRVRPECIRWSLGRDQPVGVWVAGRYIPEGKRASRKVRKELAHYLRLEHALRGDDV